MTQDTILTNGQSVPEDRSHTQLRPNGQQESYIVLTEAERARGFVKPVRYSYTHTKCGSVTTMGRALSETYARDPWFYGGTFCCACSAHFGLEEFNWSDGESMDTRKWPLEEIQRIAALRKQQKT